MATQIFKGFKQVTYEQFSALTEEQKLGYLWFVRSNISNDTYEGDIYFSSRHYGHFGGEVEELESEIKGILKDAGVIDASGATVDIIALINASKTTAGVATEMSGTSINVKVEDATENTVDNVTTNKNFIKVNDNNELEVKGVDIDAAVVSSDITLAGGVWAEEVKKVYTGGILPSGTTLQSFFQAMLCVELWGSPTEPAYSFTASVTAPNITSSLSGDVPVGTTVSFRASNGNMSAANSAKVTGYNYGYSLNGTSKTSTASSFFGNVSAPEQSGDIKLSCSVNDKLREVDSSVDGRSGATKAYYVLKGTGTYSVSETGKTVTRGTVTDQDIYNVSNLNNIRNTDKKSITNDGFQAATQETITPTSGNSKSITGYYPIYYGAMTKVNATQEDFTETVLKAFGNDKQSNPTSFSTPTGTGTFVIAVPSDNTAYAKSKLVMKDSKDMSFGNSNTFTKDIAMISNVETVNYRVFFITNAGATTSTATWTISFE